ncbi:hypothetical protein MCG98_10835 [Ruminococcus sp. OA3]|uniref:hypothetical protein n=1 Tax=Ruminococcus sp. OA3 TaxID=2914164 RepID=UPI001F051E49|nr:hypothetical protein [Ruminococcus sp. OA3]MCH1983060.1 hypothetical protein [Ruminococcus sp. OA3]
MRQRNWKRKSNIQERIKAKLYSKSGVTLVELVVTFALLGLFIAVSCQVISNALNVYYHIKGLTYGQQVSDTLLEKISGEIEGAQVSISEGDADNKDKTLKIYKNGSVIELYDRTGSHISITTTSSYGNIIDSVNVPDGGKYQDPDDGSVFNQLLIYYYAVITNAPDGSETKITRYEAVDWIFDEAVYMGYEIEKLIFSQADQNQYPPNIIKIDLTLVSDKYGSYHSVRYVECYNFVSDSDFDKIYDDSLPESPEITPDTTPEISPEITTTPEPWNEKFSDYTDDENDLVQAIHEYFNRGYQAIQVKDGIDEGDTKTSTIYAWISEFGKNSYIIIYHDGVVMNKQELQIWGESLAAVGNNTNVIDISGPVMSGSDDGNLLLDALGGDFAKKYKKPVLYFDTERKKLMAVKYSDHKENEDQWGYFNGYTADDVSRITGSS